MSLGHIYPPKKKRFDVKRYKSPPQRKKVAEVIYDGEQTYLLRHRNSGRVDVIAVYN